MIFDGDNIRAKGPGKTSYELNLGAIYKLESRQNEIQGVGLMGARELMKAMQDGSRLTGEALGMTRLALNRAEAALKLRTGIVYIDVVPEVIKAKEMSSSRSPNGSEDQRKAILVMDPEYQEAQDYVFQLQAIVELLEVKFHGFRNSYFTVQKVFDERVGGMHTGPVEGPVQTYTLGGSTLPAAPVPGRTVDVDGGSTGGARQWTETYGNPMIPTAGIQIGKARY